MKNRVNSPFYIRNFGGAESSGEANSNLPLFLENNLGHIIYYAFNIVVIFFYIKFSDFSIINYSVISSI